MITQAFDLDKTDGSFITRSKMRNHFRQLKEAEKDFSFFEEKISESCSDLTLILKHMLTFNPAFRPTAR